MVEHSAVNRRVASSNLARGANLKSRSQLDLCCFCFFSANDFWLPKLPTGISLLTDNEKPRPVFSATFLRHSTSSFNWAAYLSDTSLFANPIQNFSRSQGTRFFRRCITRNRRKLWNAFPTCFKLSFFRIGFRPSRKIFRCRRGLPESALQVSTESTPVVKMCSRKLRWASVQVSLPRDIDNLCLTCWPRRSFQYRPYLGQNPFGWVQPPCLAQLFHEHFAILTDAAVHAFASPPYRIPPSLTSCLFFTAAFPLLSNGTCRTRCDDLTP